MARDVYGLSLADVLPSPFFTCSNVNFCCSSGRPMLLKKVLAVSNSCSPRFLSQPCSCVIISIMRGRHSRAACAFRKESRVRLAITSVADTACSLLQLHRTSAFNNHQPQSGVYSNNTWLTSIYGYCGSNLTPCIGNRSPVVSAMPI